MRRASAAIRKSEVFSRTQTKVATKLRHASPDRYISDAGASRSSNETSSHGRFNGGDGASYGDIRSITNSSSSTTEVKKVVAFKLSRGPSSFMLNQQ